MFGSQILGNSEFGDGTVLNWLLFPDMDLSLSLMITEQTLLSTVLKEQLLFSVNVVKDIEVVIE